MTRAAGAVCVPMRHIHTCAISTLGTTASALKGMRTTLPPRNSMTSVVVITPGS